VAYQHWPVRDVDPLDFKANWMRAVFARASELLTDERFRRLRGALELGLGGSPYLPATRIREVLAEVDTP
jgi:hypothetical protein